MTHLLTRADLSAVKVRTRLRLNDRYHCVTLRDPANAAGLPEPREWR